MTADVTAENLYADLQAVVRDAEALLRATAGGAGEDVRDVRSRAEESLKNARARLEAVEQETLRRAKEVADQADTFVRTNPWQAVGIAAGVGLVIGMLMSRR